MVALDISGSAPKLKWYYQFARSKLAVLELTYAPQAVTEGCPRAEQCQ
jgi:hypothetical protein